MYAEGLRIYTTIDARMQRYAEEAVEEQMKQLQKRFIQHWQGQEPWRDDEGNVIDSFIVDNARALPEYKKPMKNFSQQEDTVLALLGPLREMTVFSWAGDPTAQMSPLDSLAISPKFPHPKRK